MSLTPQDVSRIARLARIRVAGGEIDAYREQLNGILDLVAQMQAADTTGVSPMAHARDVHQRLRDDTVSETDRRATYQAIAPQVEDGLYLVPKVIE